MSRKLAKILRTEITAEMPLKAMAKAIQAKGRGRDTVLAHITPKEAKKLKEMGGRGSINPETGLPEFEDDYYGGGDYIGEPADIAAQYPDLYPGGALPESDPNLGYQATVYEPEGARYSYSAAAPGYSPAVANQRAFTPVEGRLPTREEFANYPASIRALYPGDSFPLPERQRFINRGHMPEKLKWA